MDIEFELEDKNNVRVIAVQDGERKEVGHLFTPAGSGHYIKNAIQVCGFSDAYDLWGCAVFARKSDKDKVVARLINNYDPYIQVKDIQLMFDFDTEQHHTRHSKMGMDCLGCYNDPCTCDNGKFKFNENEILEGKSKIRKNPYEVKRAADLNLEKGRDETK